MIPTRIVWSSYYLIFKHKLMNELVFKGENNQVLTNSLLVAEKFGKEHRGVMQDIRELGCSQFFREHNFVLSSYNSQQNNGEGYLSTKH